MWFQNRRTKHKRMQQEDESKGGSGGGGGSTNASNSSVSSQNQYEDELIDMDDSYSEDDSDSPHWKRYKQTAVEKKERISTTIMSI